MDEIIERLRAEIKNESVLLAVYVERRKYYELGQQYSFIDGLKTALLLAKQVKVESDADFATAQEARE